MKKPYMKPVILFESFALSTNIAAGCEYEANYSRGICGYEVRGRIVFADSTMGCNSTTSVDVENGEYIYNNQVCYHVPVDTSNLFNS